MVHVFAGASLEEVGHYNSAEAVVVGDNDIDCWLWTVCCNAANSNLIGIGDSGCASVELWAKHREPLNSASISSSATNPSDSALIARMAGGTTVFWAGNSA